MIGLNPQLEQHLLDNDDSSFVHVDSNKEETLSDGSAAKNDTAEIHGENEAYAEEQDGIAANRSTGKSSTVFVGTIGSLLGYFAGRCSSRNLTVERFFQQERIDSSVVLGLAAAVLLIWMLVENATGTKGNLDYDNRRTARSEFWTKADTQCHECRTEVASLLGSVGAPPLEVAGSAKHITASLKSLSRGEEDLESLKEQLEMIVSFTRAHANLLLAIDKALEILRIGTGLKLGLGPSSRCVDRVEISTLARENRNSKNQFESNHSSSTDNISRRKGIVSLPNARRILWRVMEDQLKSLASVEACLNGKNIESQIYDEPQPITLFRLKNSRREVSELLSQVLSRMVTSSVLRDLVLEGQDLASVLRRSTWAIVEGSHHITGIFTLGSKTLLQRACSPSFAGSGLPRKHLAQMCGQLDGIYVSLWALEKCMAGNEDSSDNERSDAGKDDGFADETENVDEWLTRVDHLFQSARDSYEHLRTSLREERSKPDSTVIARDVTLTVSPDDSLLKSHPSHFEHAGESYSTFTSTVQRATPGDKCAVYAGAGTLSQQSHQAKPCYEVKEADAESNARNQANLIHELSSRLGIMDVVEEVDMTGPGAGDGDTTRFITEKPRLSDTREGRSSASALFLGASGDLLAELKVSMQTANSGGSELC